jgi:hypothetical protein
MKAIDKLADAFVKAAPETRHDKLGTDGTEAASTKAPRAVLVLNRLTPEGRSIKKQFLTERDSLPWCRA